MAKEFVNGSRFFELRILLATIILTLVFSMAGCSSQNYSHFENNEHYVVKNNKVYVVQYYPPFDMPPDFFGFLATRHENELPDIDIETFADLGYGYAKDKNHVYFVGRITLESTSEKADALTFELLGEHYGRDKNHVYYMDATGRVVEGADIESFVSIGQHTGKDAYQVFRYSGADYKFTPYDVDSFEMLEYEEWRWGRDKAYYYYCFRRQDVDYATFELLEKGYAKDKNHLYRWEGFSELQIVE